MKKLFSNVRALVRDNRGATAVEYAMIVGAVAVGSLVALNALSGRITALFNNILPPAT